jgi:hypothetical protein
MHVRSFCLLMFALPSLAAFALPPAVHGIEPRYESFSAINDLVSSLGDTVRFIG